MIKSWSEDTGPVCEYQHPACEACILEYMVALVDANRELMLKTIWQSREILMNGEGTIRELLDRFERLEESTSNIHVFFQKALQRDAAFMTALQKVRESCRCSLSW